MKRIFPLAILSLSCFEALGSNEINSRYAYRAFDTPYNYNISSLEIGTASSDTVDNDAYVMNYQSESMVNEHFILSVQGNNALLGLSGNDVPILSQSIGGGVNYRAPIIDEIDLVIGGGLTYHAYTKGSQTEVGGLGISGQVQLRLSTTDHWESLIGIRTSSVDGVATTAMNIQTNYYLSDKFGLGVSSSLTENEALIAGNVLFELF